MSKRRGLMGWLRRGTSDSGATIAPLVDFRRRSPQLIVARADEAAR
ncbi:MAG: hypothetical protein ACRDP8_05185 [Actinopolymorphaceae bacterium]